MPQQRGGLHECTGIGSERRDGTEQSEHHCDRRANDSDLQRRHQRRHRRHDHGRDSCGKSCDADYAKRPRIQ
eukprot:Nk52_evm1s1852 gene=Nk52_evmTU1s1852